MNDFLLSAGRTVRGDYAIYPNSLLFKAGEYPDKGLSMTPEELASAAATSDPIPFNLEHDTRGAHAATKGLFGGILRHWIDPTDPNLLRGEVAIPLPLDEGLATKAPSMEFARDTKLIVGAALTYTPRVSEAALMSSVAEFAMTRHNTPVGQIAIQESHDHAARSGAVCNRQNAKMSSQHEATAIQKIHDVAVDHGAKCSSGDAPEWARPMFSDSTFSGSTFSTQSKPKPASVVSAKGEKQMPTFWDNLKARLGQAGVPESDLEATFADAPTFTVGMTETEKAQFSALIADNARLKAASIAKDAATFADAAIADLRAYPAERLSLIALFSQAAQDDDAAPVKVTFSSAKDAQGVETPVTGSRVEALTFGVNSRPQHGLTTEQIKTAAFSGGFIVPRTETTDTDKINAQVEKLLASTGLGQKIAAEKAK